VLAVAACASMPNVTGRRRGDRATVEELGGSTERSSSVGGMVG